LGWKGKGSLFNNLRSRNQERGTEPSERKLSRGEPSGGEATVHRLRLDPWDQKEGKKTKPVRKRRFHRDPAAFYKAEEKEGESRDRISVSPEKVKLYRDDRGGGAQGDSKN